MPDRSYAEGINTQRIALAANLTTMGVSATATEALSALVPKVLDIVQGDDTSSGDAVASEILSGKKAWVDGAEVTGTMPDNSGDNAATSSSVDGTTLKLVAPAGYYDGGDTVTVTDADFTAANIVSGANIFGVDGSVTPWSYTSASKLYTNALKGFINGTYNWKATSGSTFKVALLGSGYTPNYDTDEFWDDISANELSASGDYSTGGETLTTADPTVDTGTNETRMDATDVSIAGFTGDVYYVVVYQSTGTASTSALICCQEISGGKSVTAATLNIEFSATGVFKITTSP